MLLILILVVLVEATAAAHGADEPGWSAGPLPSPVFLEVVFPRLKVAAGKKDREADQAIQHGVDEDASASVS